MQIFKRSSNTLSRATLGFFIVAMAITFVVIEMWTRSSYSTDLGVNIIQPVAFSHKHHVKGLGLDCRFCHASVEKGAFAGIPATSTCMNCHSHIWSKSEALKPVLESEARHLPIAWNRVNAVADYVYFDHSIHIKKGISCVNCHGHVEEMNIVHKEMSFYMRQCLDCHRHPENVVRPQREIFNFWWENKESESARLETVKKYHIDSRAITNCTACHR